MSVTNNTITNYKTVTNSKLTISCFVFHLKNAHIPLISRTILVERMPGVKKKALLQHYFGKKIRISKMKISKYVIWAGYKHRATTGCATLKQGTTVLKMKNCAINNDECFAGIINIQIVTPILLTLSLMQGVQ